MAERAAHGDSRRPPLAAVLSYCSNCANCARGLLANALLCADVVVLSVGERLYDGREESREHVERLASEFPAVLVEWYPVADGELERPVELHNRARQAGVARAERALGPAAWRDAWVLLLDGDEVPEGRRFAEWFSRAARELRPRDGVKLANHWLFLSPRLVADRAEDSVVLVHASQLTEDALRHPRERDGVLAARGLRELRDTRGLDGQPMFWHYSWVRADRASLRAKVANWGHSRERDWAALVDAAMDAVERGEFPARDFVHGYALRLLDAPGHGWEAGARAV